MSKATVRCRCGHQVLAKEVLRTDLLERSRGRDYVYVKFRCRRCKRMGEVFIAESRWDWSLLEAEHTEMDEQERERFAAQEPISSAQVLDFHRALQSISAIEQLGALETSLPAYNGEPDPPIKPELALPEAAGEATQETSKIEPRATETKSGPDNRAARLDEISTNRTRPGESASRRSLNERGPNDDPQPEASSPT